MVRAVLEEVCSLQEAQHGTGWVAGEINIVFYVDDGRIAGHDYEWLQDALDVTVAMFWRMGLETNLEKNKAMVCTTGFIWGKWRELAYKRQVTWDGATFRERKKTRLRCYK